MGEPTTDVRDLQLPAQMIPDIGTAYRMLVEQLPAVTFISRLDRSSAPCYISPQIDQISGYSSEQLSSDRDLWTNLIHPDDRTRVLVARAKHIVTGLPLSEEYRFVGREGAIRWVVEESRIVQDREGQPIIAQGILLDVTARKAARDQLQATREIEDRLALELAGAKMESGIHALLAALNARDGYTSEHSEAVVELVERVTARLDLSPQEVEVARNVALLHDIGKIGVPDSILRKSGALDEREWRVMREHPVIGARIVESIPGLEDLAPAIRAEHERWDGQGYPDGLSGEEIPIASRVAFVCDAYHAMISNRPYRRAMPRAEARKELQKEAGTQFDARMIDVLIAILDEEAAPVPDEGTPPIRVLLVDDDLSTRKLLRFTLEGEPPFEIIGEAENGDEALEMTRKESPDAIVIDLSMPSMGGLDVIPLIKEWRAATKILVFTASDSRDVFEEALRLGADGCLGKGVSLTEVDRALRTLCSTRPPRVL